MFFFGLLLRWPVFDLFSFLPEPFSHTVLHKTSKQDNMAVNGKEAVLNPKSHGIPRNKKHVSMVLHVYTYTRIYE